MTVDDRRSFWKALVRIARRFDDWTLVAFNPQQTARRR